MNSHYLSIERVHKTINLEKNRYKINMNIIKDYF